MLRKALTIAIAGALAAPMAAQAADEAKVAPEAEKEPGFNVSIGGRVSRALIVIDGDGGNDSASVKDYAASGSRFSIDGAMEGLEEGVTPGFQFEYAAPGGGANSPTLRHAYASFGGGFGTVKVGHTSQAGPAASKKQIDVLIGQGTVASYLGKSAAYFGSLDGGGRKELIRYDSPSLGIATVGMSVANEGSYGGNIGIGGDYGEMTFAANLGYLKTEGDSTKASSELGADGVVVITGKGRTPDSTTIGASLGAKLANGFGWSLGWAKQTNEGGISGRKSSGTQTPHPNSDPSRVQAQVGYEFGSNAIAVSWYKSSDFVNEGSEGSILGIGVKHTVPKTGVSLYANAQRFKVEDAKDTKDTKDTVLAIGTVVVF